LRHRYPLLKIISNPQVQMHKPALRQLTDRLRSGSDARIALYENQLERLCGRCKAYPVRSILAQKDDRRLGTGDPAVCELQQMQRS
jgi:hypothetical protein